MAVASIWFENGRAVGLIFKIGEVMGPKSSTDGGA